MSVVRKKNAGIRIGIGISEGGLETRNEQNQ